MINYKSRSKKQAFVTFANPAKEAMLFVGYEYRTGGGPVYRAFEKSDVRKSGNRYRRALHRLQLWERVRAAHKHGGMRYLAGTVRAKIARATSRQKCRQK